MSDSLGQLRWTRRARCQAQVYTTSNTVEQKKCIEAFLTNLYKHYRLLEALWIDIIREAQMDPSTAHDACHARFMHERGSEDVKLYSTCPKGTRYPHKAREASKGLFAWLTLKYLHICVKVERVRN